MANRPPSLRHEEPLTGWAWEELSAPLPPEAKGANAPAPEATLEEGLSRAFQQGMAEGKRKGLEQARREMEACALTVEKAAEQLAGIRKQWSSALEQNVSALGLVVARLLVDREVEADPGILSGLVQSALAHFPPNQGVRIRVNPTDFAILTADPQGGEDYGSQGEGREVRWIPDSRVGRGGCVVEGPEKIVDGRIEAALERIYRKVTDG